jgi:hypothetical protein
MAELAPDISSVAPDLTVPELSAGEPSPGRRVKQTLPGWPAPGVYHVLYFPTNWMPAKRYPVIAEYMGNGGYRNDYGDSTEGRPEESNLGFGIGAGEGFIWLCLPFLDGAGTANVPTWWGTPPAYDPQPTIAYARQAIPWICAQYGGDPARVIYAGFSRGAIAGNAIGLHDDAIAGLWRAFVLYSHYEGVREWPYPHSTGAAALARLRRLGSRPQFICHENDGALARAKAYLQSTGVPGNFTFQETGFRNHNDAWLLRPSPARRGLREWVQRVIA